MVASKGIVNKSNTERTSQKQLQRTMTAEYKDLIYTSLGVSFFSLFVLTLIHLHLGCTHAFCNTGGMSTKRLHLTRRRKHCTDQVFLPAVFSGTLWVSVCSDYLSEPHGWNLPQKTKMHQEKPAWLCIFYLLLHAKYFILVWDYKLLILT